MLIFEAYTGLRPGELYALRYDVLGAETLEVKRAADSHTRTVTLPKTGPRVVVYPAKAREAIESVPRLAGVDLVFPSPSGGQLWSSSFSWIWKPVRCAFGRPTMGASRASSLLRDVPAGAGLGAGRRRRAARAHRWRRARDEHVRPSVRSRCASAHRCCDGRPGDRRAASVPRPRGLVDAVRYGPGTRFRRSRATAAAGFVLLLSLFWPAGRAGLSGASSPSIRPACRAGRAF